MSFQVETGKCNPRPSTETMQTFGVGGEPGQPRFQLADHSREIIKHAVRKLFFRLAVPHLLLWVEF